MSLKKLIRSKKQIEKNYSTYLILGSLMLFIGIMSSPQIAPAQTDMTLTGTVTDSSGAVVPQATVELFNAATKDTRRQITGQDGRYSFPTVARGKYRLTVSMAGFRKKVISDISVDTPKSYQRDAQRPFAAHAQRGDETKRAQVPRLLREVRQTGEQRIRQDAERHGAHPADAVAQPAEDQPAAGRAHEKQRGDLPHPHLDELFVQHAGGGLHLLQRGPRHEREDAHLHPVEHPAEKGRQQHQPLAFVLRSRVGGEHEVGDWVAGAAVSQLVMVTTEGTSPGGVNVILARCGPEGSATARTERRTR